MLKDKERMDLRFRDKSVVLKIPLRRRRERIEGGREERTKTRNVYNNRGS